MTWCSSMHSSRADWVLAEARLISSPMTMLANTAPGPELKGPRRLVVDGHARDIGGEQIRGELDPADGTVDGAGQGLRQQGLADARDVLKEQVALGQQHGQGQLGRFGLAIDHGVDGGQDALAGGAESLRVHGRGRLVAVDAGSGTPGPQTFPAKPWPAGRASSRERAVGSPSATFQPWWCPGTVTAGACRCPSVGVRISSVPDVLTQLPGLTESSG